MQNLHLSIESHPGVDKTLTQKLFWKEAIFAQGFTAICGGVGGEG